MKFPQLPLGARFQYDGKSYVKTSPIAASGEDGQTRMIPRYAQVLPLDAGHAAPPKVERRFAEAEVMRAFEAAVTECGGRLAAGADADSALAAARTRFREALL